MTEKKKVLNENRTPFLPSADSDEEAPGTHAGGGRLEESKRENTRFVKYLNEKADGGR